MMERSIFTFFGWELCQSKHGEGIRSGMREREREQNR